jgi:alkylation response protein AidB-like acyl-CoA dehydrogenase
VVVERTDATPPRGYRSGIGRRAKVPAGNIVTISASYAVYLRYAPPSCQARIMQFMWSDEQRRLHAEAAEFARRELNARIEERDHTAEFDVRSWRRCGDFGVLGWAVPAAHGGAGHDVVTAAYLMEALGHGCHDNGLAFGLGTQMWGFQVALLQFGTDAQVSRYLARSVHGDLIAAFAMTELGSGSDAFSIACSAARERSDYVLNGEKVLVTFGPIADLAIVFAKTDPSAGRWGISSFLVEADTPGFIAHAPESTMGLRTIPIGRLTLENCRVPASQLFGKEGAGASIFTSYQSWERSFVLAPQIGAMRRLLDDCVEVARTRIRAGQPIGRNQAVAHRIADMKLRLEAARMLLYRTAWLQGNEKPSLMEASLTKIFLSEAFVQSSLDAIAIHGGAGYDTATGVERNLRDAIGATTYGGTVDIQRNIVAGLLGL